MNIEKLNDAIEILKKNLGEGLIETDIFKTTDAVSIVGYNSKHANSLLFNYLTTDVINTLRSAKFSSLNKYMIVMDLENNQMLIILPVGDYRWGIIVDTNNIKLGVLLNLAIPKCLESFEEAL